MSDVEAALDRLAEDTPYADLAQAFLDLDRWTGDDPVLLLAEAAASTTGQRFATGIRPSVERFRDAFVDTGRADTIADVAALDPEANALVEAFGAQRKRHVLVEAATVLDDRPEDDDLAALQGWAAEADVYAYDADPIGAISGVGPSSFQYLRMLAGVDTAKPDPEVARLVEAIADEVDSPYLDPSTSEPLRTLASVEWLAATTDYRAIELDRLAWWTYTEDEQREAVLALDEE